MSFVVVEQTDPDGRAVTTSREDGGSVRMISRSDEGHESFEVNTVWQNIHYNQATWSALFRCDTSHLSALFPAFHNDC